MINLTYKLGLLCQLCLLVLISRANCGRQYELNCLNKDCSDILHEGFSQYVHAGDGDLIKLGNGESLKIYGENEEFYLIQKQNRQGLVKKNYVKINKSNDKDKPLIKIKASFTNKKLYLVDFEGNKTNIDTHQDLNYLANSLGDDQIVKHEQESIINEKNNESTNLNDSDLNKETINKQTPTKKSDFLAVPLVQNLHRNLRNDEPTPANSVESLKLKEPEIQNFSHDIKASNLSEDLLNQPSKHDQNQTSTDQPSVPSNESNDQILVVKISSPAKSTDENKSTETLNEGENLSDSKIDDFNALKDSYKDSIPADEVLPLKLNLSVETSESSNDTNKSTDQKKIEEKSIFDTVEVAEENSEENLDESSEENPEETENSDSLKDEDVKVENSAEEQIQGNENAGIVDNDKSKDEKTPSTPQPVGQPFSEISPDLDKLVTTPEPVIQLNIPAQDISSQFKPAIKNVDNSQVNDQSSIDTPLSVDKLQIDQPNLASIDQTSFLNQPNAMPSITSNLPEGKKSIDEPIIDNPSSTSINLEMPKEANLIKSKQKIDSRSEPKIPSRHAKIINLNAKKQMLDQQKENSIPESEPIQSDKDETIQKSKEAYSSIGDSSFLSEQDSVRYCSADLINKARDQPSFYISILRSVLGGIVDMLPQSLVLFFEFSLQISAKLLMFVFLIGILWIVLFVVKLFHISLSNETILKNHLCESQSKMSLIQRERDDLRNKLNTQNLKLAKGLEDRRQEVDNQLNKLNVENKQLKESKFFIEKELNEQRNSSKNLEEQIEKLKEKNVSISKQNETLNKTLAETETTNNELRKSLEQLEKSKKDLADRNEEIKQKIEESKCQINYLKDQLEEQIKLISEKDIEISCLNKMLNEWKESKELTKESKVINDESDSTEQNDDSIITGNSTGNFYDVVKLRCEIEKLEKERNETNENLSLSLKQIKILESKLEKLEEESNHYNETKNKVLKEKEEAEKYLDFLKKYYNENKNELQKELGVHQYKEKQLVDENKELQTKIEIMEKKIEESEQKYQIIKKEFEETEKQLREELLTSNKSACDYFKSAQALKTELVSVKKDAEYLRQQLRNPPTSIDSNQSKSAATAISPPPEIPKSILDLISQMASGNTSGLPNLNNLNNLTNSNFMTAPSPIPPQSLGYDYQQANYQGGLTNLPYSSQSSQPPASMYNNVNAVPTSASFQQMVDPLMLNHPISSATDVYPQEYHYTSLPNIPYSNHQSIDPRFNQSLLAQQQHWDPRNTSYTPLNETMNEGNTSNSPHPSLHNIQF